MSEEGVPLTAEEARERSANAERRKVYRQIRKGSDYGTSTTVLAIKDEGFVSDLIQQGYSLRLVKSGDGPDRWHEISWKE